MTTKTKTMQIKVSNCPSIKDGTYAMLHCTISSNHYMMASQHVGIFVEKKYCTIVKETPAK